MGLSGVFSDLVTPVLPVVLDGQSADLSAHGTSDAAPLCEVVALVVLAQGNLYYRGPHR